MAIYYIDPVGGQASAAGLSESAPRASVVGLTLRGGDSVLFKRGSVIRDAVHSVSGEEGRPIFYGAYGEGDDPVFMGSVDVSGAESWVSAGESLWRCTRPLATETCNLIFDSREGGALQWDKTDLSENGDWWDSGFGTDVESPDAHELILYCDCNPGLKYGHIEAALRVHRELARTGHDMIFEHLTFRNAGVHAIAGGGPSRNMIVRACRFEFIGGSVWSKKLHIRFGNGVECWNTGENILVEDNVFYEIYDSAVTHQGGKECVAAQDFVIRRNVFIRCGMAAYEQRDVLPLSAEFVNNVCMDAGRGFSHRHTTSPRQSEIWPQPMGHHIFLWRIEQPTEGERFIIKRNLFLDAPAGAAIYSIICRAAEEQIEIDENTYQMRERTLVNRYFGEDFATFAAYAAATGKDGHSAAYGEA